MFDAALVDAVDYRNPWDLTLEERVGLLKGEGRRVVYFYDNPDTSTFRYRVFNMVTALANGGDDVRASWFHRGDFGNIERVVDRADVLILCRTRYSPAVGRLIAHARRRNIRVIYDTDDLIFNTEAAPLIIDTIGAEENSDAVLDYWFAYISRQGTVMKLCDRVITTNAFLGQQAKLFAPHASICIVPNFLNREQQQLSTHIYERKLKAKFFSRMPIQIGYFSGSPSHERDFAVASKALARLMKHDPDLHLTIVGFLGIGKDLAQYEDRIERHSLQDFMNLQLLVGRTEINIAPLVENTFTNCKSELKFFEAAITGSITVASPTFTFSRAIREGETGFIAKAHEWEEKLHKAVALVREPDQYAAMAKGGFAYAEAHYGWDKQGAVIREAIFGDA